MSSTGLSDNEELVRRFSVYRIVEHLILILLFIALTATGLSQKFNSLGISQSLIIGLGGVDHVRSLHHIAGVLFTILAALHIFIAVAGISFRQWEPSMLITFKDAFDALYNVRYYLGLTDKPAKCGRYTYKEKFVYWLVLPGGVQMIVTGFILWFPVAVTKYLPGQFIPVSKTIHTNEAMLIFLLTAIWHIYDSIFSPDVFPLDKSIFTGYISKRRLTQEHPLEAEQLHDTGNEKSGDAIAEDCA